LLKKLLKYVENSILHINIILVRAGLTEIKFPFRTPSSSPLVKGEKKRRQK
tara:strand:- start:186 stop:338 length:153 start_codon:yes stop_codon:yes gene_type:complete